MKVKYAIMFVILLSVSLIACAGNTSEMNKDTQSGDFSDETKETQIFNAPVEYETTEKGIGQEQNSIQGDSAFISEMIGRYEYASERAENGTGILEISSNSEYNFVDIIDWECGEEGSTYRFAANSSNIESESDNKIYLKYPQMVYEDSYEVFSYYILKKTERGINVYNSDTSFEDAKFLYSAIPTS